MTIPSSPILIAGGGIGGLAAAITLRRVGFDALVFERAAEPAEVGAGISLWPNATRQLRRWGVLDDVMRSGFVFRGGVIRNPAGAELSRISTGEHDAPSILIHRAALHSALLAQLPAWTVFGGAALQGFVDDGAGVRARFAGLGEVEGAALIGADGLRSTVRRILLD
ncbi:MAG TPA: FAD-dependent monooxygenase, partial [Longimicrobium sp.]